MQLLNSNDSLHAEQKHFEYSHRRWQKFAVKQDTL